MKTGFYSEMYNKRAEVPSFQIEELFYTQFNIEVNQKLVQLKSFLG